jgi:hypothetical protein
VGFLEKFFTKKGITVGKEGISFTSSSARSWSQTEESGDPAALPDIADLLKGLPGGLQSQLAAELKQPSSQAASPSGTAAVDLSTFSLRALAAIDAVYLAWRTNDPSRAEPFVSNDFLKRWSLPDSWRPAKNRSTNLTIGNATIEGGRDHVVAQVKTTADGQTLNETWTFIRAPKGQPGSSTELRCPSCGAPFPQAQAGTCSYCGAEVVPPPMDWVVDSIQSA